MKDNPRVPASDMGKVFWLPSHPVMGYFSMDNYWRALEAGRETFEDHGYSPTSVLGKPPKETQKKSRWVRAAARYLLYPYLIRQLPPGSLVHFLDHTLAFLLPLLPKGCRTIVTVHDVVPLMDSSRLTGAQVERFRRILLNLKHADQVIADSTFTAQKIEELLGIPGSKIKVSLLGVESAIVTKKVEVVSSKIRLLSIGGNVARKNLQILPAIVEGLISKGHDVKLMRIGDYLDSSVQERLRKCLGDNLVERGHIGDSEVQEAYQQNDILIFPSYLEGFGLPLLEAMANDCCVVSSDASSLPEVGQDAALYFSPDRPEEAVAQIERLWLDPALRERLRSAGRKRVAELDWANHCRHLTVIYDEVLAGV